MWEGVKCVPTKWWISCI